MDKLPRGSSWSNRAADGKHFKNLMEGSPMKISNSAILKYGWSRLRGYLKRPKDGYKAFGERWYKSCSLNDKCNVLRRDPSALARDHVFWIGHATSLLCLWSGTNVLFDPIFSHRCSPVLWAGPARRFPPATEINQLPEIHIVTISHNHYDHLDKKSIVALYERFPQVKFIVPLQLERLLKPWGIRSTSIMSMDWWEEVRVRDVVVACTPAHHWSKHSLCDNNEVLWCGWCIGWSEKGEQALDQLTQAFPGGEATDQIPTAATVAWDKLKTYYFTGDTAFNETMFELMHKRYPRIDMAALPIGAYEPRDFMKTQHMDPESSVRTFQILGAKKALAVHWGTFELALELIDEPPKVLANALAAESIDPERFLAIPMGTSIPF